MAREERARAIGLLRQAVQQGFSGWRVPHRDPDLAPLRADPAFQEWIRLLALRGEAEPRLQPEVQQARPALAALERASTMR